MTAGERPNARRAVRRFLTRELPEPTSDFRLDAWRAFQAALDRHLGSQQRKRPGVAR